MLAMAEETVLADGIRRRFWPLTLYALVLIFEPVSAKAQSSGQSQAKPVEQDASPSVLDMPRSQLLTFEFHGQLRARYENDSGFTLKGYEPAGHDELLLERVRLDLSMRVRENARFFLQLQDAHAFLTRFEDGDFPKSSPIEDTLDVRQLYGELLHIGGSAVGFKIGRQQISYGDQRVFGPGNWGNTGRFAWDAAMLKIDTKRLSSDFWAGSFLRYKSDKWPNPHTDDFLTFVNYTQVKKLPFRLDLFYVLKRDTSGTVYSESKTGNLLSHTIGFQAEGKFFNVFDGEATYAGQFGKQGGDKVRAQGASGKLGVTLPHAWTPRIGAQVTWGSGDSNPADGIHETFDGVYGGRDIFFYGNLNLFFWANLLDSEIDLSLHPHNTVAINAEYHHFALDQSRDAWYSTGLQAQRRDLSGGSGRNLGDEVDLRVSWTLRKRTEIMAGFGRFFPGSFVERTGPAAAANWFCLQTAYTW
jgi:hypothetical protein